MTTLTIAWEAIPCLDLNSRIEVYTLILTPISPPQTSINSTLTSLTTAHTFTGLIPAALYTVELNATYTVTDFTSPINAEIALPINASTFSIPGTIWNGVRHKLGMGSQRCT